MSTIDDVELSPPVPSRDERALCRLVEDSVGAVLTWDKGAVGAVVFTGQRFGLRTLNFSQVVALLIERRRRLDAGEDHLAVEKFLSDHGYEWRPWKRTA